MSQICTETDPQALAAWVCDARQRTLELIVDLSDEQLIGPRLEIVNPLLWEIGHAAYFQENWVLRHAAGQEPLRPDLGNMYDSIEIAHNTRWDLPLPSRRETLDYVCEVRDRVLDLLDRSRVSDELVYMVKYSVFHEDMHTEAFTYTRQTLAFPPPQLAGVTDGPEADATVHAAEADSEDVDVPGGPFLLGATREEPFVFDNEKWAHQRQVEPFRIARTQVTQGQFAAFVEDDGYERRELWSEDGWNWREAAGAEHPVYWQPAADSRRTKWLRRHFDEWVPLEPDLPVIHVNWYEAEAWCNWAGRRLPTELEWEAAASASHDASGEILSAEKRRFPWGNVPADHGQANLDWRGMGAVDAAALPEGDSAFGCRQMLGNVWEWTARDFQPFPGFMPDMYEQYSQTSFGNCKVLRGGCWATRARLIRNTWRNFYQPHRRDVWAGFRTCAKSRSSRE